MIKAFAGPVGIAVSVALGGAPAMAGPDRFSVLLGAKHIDVTGFNEITPGLFATWEGERLGYSLGAYVNSYNRGSVAATAHLPLAQWDQGALSVFAGLAWYPRDGHRFETRIVGDVVGIGGVELRHGHVFAQFLPMFAGGAKGVVSFGLTWDVGQ